MDHLIAARVVLISGVKIVINNKSFLATYVGIPEFSKISLI